jgi:hypothetical protein
VEAKINDDQYVYSNRHRYDSVFYALSKVVGDCDLDVAVREAPAQPLDADAAGTDEEFDQLEQQPLQGRLSTLAAKQVVDLWQLMKLVLKGGPNLVVGEMRCGKSLAILAQAMMNRALGYQSLVIECHLVAALKELVANLNNGVSDPLFKVTASFLDAREVTRIKKAGEAGDALRAKIKSGEHVLVVHHCKDSIVKASGIVDHLQLQDVHLICDEFDALHATAGTGRPKNQREEAFGRLYAKVKAVYSVSATQLSVIAWLLSIGATGVGYSCSVDQLLETVNYTGIDKIQKFVMNGEEVSIPDTFPARNSPYTRAKLYGLNTDTPILPALDAMVADQAPNKLINVHLGTFVTAQGGTAEQRDFLLARYAGRNVKIVTVNGGCVSVFSDDQNGVPYKTPKEAVASFDDQPDAVVILLGNRCMLRGVECNSDRRSVTHVIVVCGDGMNVSDLYQLLGRGCGRGTNQVVHVVMRDADFKVIKGLKKFQLDAIKAFSCGVDPRAHAYVGEHQYCANADNDNCRNITI